MHVAMSKKFLYISINFPEIAKNFKANVDNEVAPIPKKVQTFGINEKKIPETPSSLTCKSSSKCVIGSAAAHIQDGKKCCASCI